MSVHITDEDALDKLMDLEGFEWVSHQLDDRLGDRDYGFFQAFHRWRRDHMASEIYGSCGLARYYVKSTDGRIVLSGRSTTQATEEVAERLGFDVVKHDRKATQREEQVRLTYEADRRGSLVELVDAIVTDVAIAMGISPDEARERMEGSDPARALGVKAVIAARITGWVSYRLGIIDPLDMSDLATVCRQRSESDGYVVISGDLSMRVDG